MIAPLVLLTWLSVDEIDDGTDAYRKQQFAEAQAQFEKAIEQAGDQVPAELWFNTALTALQSGDLDRSEEAARAAITSGSEEVDALGEFLLGNVWYARSRKTGALAERPEAEPFLYDRAIAEAERARAAWERAARSRDDWPEAIRNLERAIRWAEELRRRQKENDEGKTRPPDDVEPAEDDPEEQEDEGDLPTPPPLPPPIDLQPLVDPPPLTADELDELRRLLERKDRDKRALRAEQRRQDALRTERDW